MRREHVILFFIGALVLLGGWLAWNYIADTRVEYIEERFPSPKLLFDEYLVAERFLDEGDTHAMRRSTLPGERRLNRTGAVFILADSSRMGSQDIQRLLQWVRQGAHLIVAAQESEVIYEQRLLQGLGIERRRIEKEENTEACAVDPDSICIDVDGIPARVGFGSDGLAYDPYEATPEWDISAPFVQKPHQMRFRAGKGIITIIPDSRPWQNLSINEYDHAFILQKWMEGFGEVLLVTKPEPPGFLALIWRSAYEAVLAGLILLALWLLRRSRRFGPMQALPAPARRSLVEYLHAASLFRWKYHQTDFLLEQARRPLKERILRRYPQSAAMDDVECAKLLAGRTGLPARNIHSALYEEVPKNKTRMRSIASDIQILWKNL